MMPLSAPSPHQTINPLTSDASTGSSTLPGKHVAGLVRLFEGMSNSSITPGNGRVSPSQNSQPLTPAASPLASNLVQRPPDPAKARIPGTGSGLRHGTRVGPGSATGQPRRQDAASRSTTRLFRGKADDRVEQSITARDPAISFIARGLTSFAAQGPQQTLLTDKVKQGQRVAVDMLTSALAAIEHTDTQVDDLTCRALITGLLGGTPPSATNLTMIKNGLKKLLDIQQARLIPGNDQMVIYEKSSPLSESAFVSLSDEHQRLFLNKTTITSADLTSLAMVFIHQDSYIRLKTDDLFFMAHTRFFDPQRNNNNINMALAEAMDISLDVGKNQRESTFLCGDGKPYANAARNRQGEPLPIDQIMLKNADTWSFLAAGLGAAAVIKHAQIPPAPSRRGTLPL